jgi:hypothetical protein
MNFHDNVQGAVIMELKKHNWNLNFNSLAIGFVMALCLILAIGAAENNDHTGQYQCCSAGGDDLAVFVIDTETGQTWRLSRTDMYDFGTPYRRKSIRRSITPMVE